MNEIEWIKRLRDRSESIPVATSDSSRLVLEGIVQRFRMGRRRAWRMVLGGALIITFASVASAIYVRSKEDQHGLASLEFLRESNSGVLARVLAP